MFEKVCNLAIFTGIHSPVVQDILDNCETKTFKSGETIIKEGEEPNGEGYIIEKGGVDVVISEKKIAELEMGDIFGEIALLNEEERTATVIANSDVSVIILSLNNLIDMINNDDNTINKTILRRIEENLERNS